MNETTENNSGGAISEVPGNSADKENNVSDKENNVPEKEESNAPDKESTESISPDKESITANGDSEKMTRSLADARNDVMRLNRRIAELNVARRTDSAINDYRRWMKEAEALKAEYPGFDIEAESKDARFVSLLKSGIDVRSAYTALHSGDIIAASVEKARSEIAADILRRNARPRENGISDQSAAVGKPDISSLSRSEVEAIERRVARGEKIYLK